jgi:hypothetical protein
MEGGSLIKNMERNKISVGTNSVREELFQFAHENACLDAVHSQGHTKHLKIGLLLALAKLPEQYSLEIIKRVIGLVAGIEGIQNISQNLFGQVGKGLPMFNFLRSDPSLGDLCLNKAEPEFWYFLIIGAQFHFSQFPTSCRCCVKVVVPGVGMTSMPA